MKRFFSFFLFVITPMLLIGQELTVLSNLNETLNETSGLIYLNSKLISHNDSGGEAALFEINSTNGAILRKMSISNASNVDWEDVCFDENYIYIGDFGNNKGSRKDLKIYKISISDYLNTINNSITAEIISFNYADQTDFSSTESTTNYDAETLITIDGNLYIFTKNWGDNRTNIYAVPKSPGNYTSDKIDTFDAQGLVTGGTYNVASKSIVLTGYTLTTNFIIEISQFTGYEFSKGTINRFTINPNGSRQIEGIDAINDQEYYLSAEKNLFGAATLYKLKGETSLAVESILNKPSKFFPNPASEKVYISCDNLSRVELFDFHGNLLKIFYSNTLDVSNLPSGIYIALIKKNDGSKSDIRKLIIE